MIEHVYKQEVEKMDIEGRHEIASARFSAYLCHRISATNDEVNHAYATELDSHADSPVVGQGARVLEHTGRTVRVSGFSGELGSALTVPVVHAAVAYDCEITGKTHILVIHNALYLRSMKTNLIPPFMMRLAGLQVNECPKFLSLAPSINDHSVYFPAADVRFPFQIEGIVSYLSTRIPSDQELSDYAGEYLLLTPNAEDWDPHTAKYKDQEFGMTNYRGELKERPEDRILISSVNQSSIDCFTDPESFAAAMESKVHRIRSVTSNQPKKKHKSVKASDLARRWRIPLAQAQKTIEMTTQRCVRSGEVPSLNRRYKTNDRMLRYARVSTDVFMDTFFTAKRLGPSTRGFTCCQIFVTEFGHVFVVPLQSKAGERIKYALKKYFKDVGVPPMIICDAAREQVQGDALLLCNEAGCQIYELAKDTPAANRAERYIKMIKDATKKDLVTSNCPMLFWDYCIERRAKIINAVARDNSHLQGQVPEMKMTGQACDISHICEFEWYEWVKYRKEGHSFPLPSERLGRVLGPAEHAGHAMSQWILTEGGKILPIQTVRRLTPAEIDSPIEKDRRKDFDDYVIKRFGDSLRPPGAQDTSDDNVEYYDDDVNGESQLPDTDVFPDYDEYLNTEVLLPQDREHMRAA